MTKKKENNNRSLWGDAWMKLKKNKPAMLGLIVISFAVLISILGANIRPDATPDANDQHPPIAKLTPGSEIDMLKIRKNEEVEKSGFFGKLFMGGSENDYKSYPFLSYQFDGINLVIEDYYIAGPMSKYEASYRSYALPEILYPLDIEKDEKFKILENNQVEIYLLSKETITKSIDEMQKEIKEKNITKQKFYLGTDRHGRDFLSRIMSGTIISLSVGLISVFIAIVIGLIMGALAGYYRGWVDEVIMFVINVIWSIPALLLIISIMMIVGKGFTTVFMAVGLIMWVDLARLVRGQVLSLREKEFIEAGRALGFNDVRIIGRHVLPNIIGPVIVQSANNFATAILLEAGLSYLGIGTQIPMASWGSIITDHQGFINQPEYSFLALVPGICIVILVFSFMLLGNGLRDAFDTKGMDSL